MEQITDQIEKLSVKSKVNRKNLTAYWGIEISPEVFEHEQIKSHLTAKSHLKPLEKIHSTLLYVGKKDDNPHESKFYPLEGKECTLQISRFGCSDDAMALHVDKVTHVEDQKVVDVPTHATQQHITMALRQGVKPVDSVKSFDSGLITLT